MTSPASRIRNRRARVAAVCGSLAAVAALSAGSSRAQAEGAASSPEAAPPAIAATRSANPFGSHFPNVVLKAHTGRNVRFYDDLLKGKIVLINFMYATCTER